MSATRRNLLALADALDAASNVHGALRPEIRARLFAAVEDPAKHWEDARGIILDGRVLGVTLWQATLAHTAYDGRTGGAPAPRSGQIVAAIVAATRVSR